MIYLNDWLLKQLILLLRSEDAAVHPKVDDDLRSLRQISKREHPFRNNSQENKQMVATLDDTKRQAIGRKLAD
ncbi:MAG: hypothetical protein F6K28_38860, partial [Microcoleus sp. SIO2G3]|nr:hypothetical protein [Microcoleus sp. SIO2G3]